MITMQQAREMRKDAILSGDRNQCGECGQLFNSTFAFEYHRTGKHGTAENPESTRRCLSIEEMKGVGMARNEAGFWVSARMSDEAREAKEASA